MKESGAERNYTGIRWKTTMFLILIFGTISYGQQCDYSTGIITFNSQGGNMTETYKTSYLLTDHQGQIIKITEDTQFEILTEGFYSIYAVNYKTTSVPDGIVVGDNILNVTGSCLDVGNPFSFTVCAEIDNCSYCLGEDVVLTSTGGNSDPGFVTEYFLTDNGGNILIIQNSPEFSDLDVGSYVIFAINYDSTKGITGFAIGSNITEISGVCFEISPGMIIGVCQTLDPTIFFDLKGCDITETALLQVGELYNSYSWSTGSTSDFIIIDAQLPATYRVTVSLASGCQGIAEQVITGDEVSTIGDYVFDDFNGNGLQDETEAGINGVVVNLYADFNKDGKPDFSQFPSCTTVTTNHPNTGEPGFYIFHVYRSNYVIEFVTPDGYEITQQNQGGDNTLDSDAKENGFTGTIGVLSGEVLADIDAGFTTSSSVGGTVWNDRDGDGVEDDEEEGLNDVVINLYNTLGALVATTVTLTNPSTGLDGFYCFDNLVPGLYYTEIEIPEGLVLSRPNATGDKTRDSNADGSNGPGTTPFFNAVRGAKTVNIDFGVYPGATICGLVWRDSIQGNPGIYDFLTDMPVEGVQVSLVSLDLNQTVQVINTDQNGSYCLTDIGLGSYGVQFFGVNLPTFVQQNVGNDPEIDSDVNTTTGFTPVFFVNPGDSVTGINAGITQNALPVDLVSFTGYWNEHLDANQLTWQTVNEINNDYFIVEKAYGDDSEFRELGMVDGSGNSSALLEYEYLDRNTAKSGTYYYRLRQVDYDGSFEYSDIIEIDVERNKSISWKIFPNPTSEHIKISINAISATSAEFNLTDITGRSVVSWEGQDIASGDTEILLPLNNVSRGTYFLGIQLGTLRFNEVVQIFN